MLLQDRDDIRQLDGQAVDSDPAGHLEDLGIQALVIEVALQRGGPSEGDYAFGDVFGADLTTSGSGTGTGSGAGIGAGSEAGADGAAGVGNGPGTVSRAPPPSALSALRAGGLARHPEGGGARETWGHTGVWLGSVDPGRPEGDPLPPLPEGCFGLIDPEADCEPLVRVLRAFKPQVVTTYDENGGYPHPDHIMCHRLTMAAVDAAADPARFPEAGEPWQVSKVYYHMGFHRRRFAALDALMHVHGLESPYAERLKDWEDLEFEKRLTTFVPCADYFEVRDDALKAHATQIDPDGLWFAVPTAIQKAGWPTEDFQLAKSTVPVTLPEDDLFAGIVEGAPCATGGKVDVWCSWI